MASQAPSPQDPSSHPHRAHRPSIQLTEEEKAVLLECRRNSMIRGFALGTVSCLVLRWFVNSGRVPMHMQRRRWFYYAGLYTGTFFLGMSSYKQRCFDKIMALENSPLADQLRQYLEKDWSKCVKNENDGTEQGHQKRHHSHRKRYQPPSTPAPSPSPYMGHKEGTGNYGGGVTTTSGRPYDQRQLDSRPSQQELPSDQPDAFSGSGGGTTGTNFQEASSPEQGQWTTPTRTQGRTFDEIREESRRQQLQKNFPRVGRVEEGRKEEVYVEKGDWTQRQETRGSGRPVRRNKYGDIIED